MGKSRSRPTDLARSCCHVGKRAQLGLILPLLSRSWIPQMPQWAFSDCCMKFRGITSESSFTRTSGFKNRIYSASPAAAPWLHAAAKPLLYRLRINVIGRMELLSHWSESSDEALSITTIRGFEDR